MPRLTYKTRDNANDVLRKLHSDGKISQEVLEISKLSTWHDCVDGKSAGSDLKDVVLQFQLAVNALEKWEKACLLLDGE